MQQENFANSLFLSNTKQLFFVCLYKDGIVELNLKNQFIKIEFIDGNTGLFLTKYNIYVCSNKVK